MSEETTTEKPERAQQEKVVVRSYTKGIYLYPTVIVGFILFAIMEYADELVRTTFGVEQPEFLNYVATIWFIIFTFNVIVISFDFTLGKVFTGSVLVFTLVLVYSIVFPEGLSSGLSLQEIFNFGGGMSSALYLWISLMVLIVIGIDFVRARFDYWVFTSNRIEHHRGIFEREMSFSAQNSRVTTQTDDIFERVLFLAGTIFVQDPDRRVWPIYNVFGATGKDKRIQELLSVVRVKTD
ncbi:MAG: hypothetical protein ACW981_17345 [Candidatus Hodarchaeales archaeon]